MKKILASVLAALALCAVCSYAEKTMTPPNPPQGLARGFANILTAWLEIPRGIIYENARIPVVGFLAGPLKGACLMVWRECAGITDVMCMGLTREGLYSRCVPEFVWDADWIPVVGEDLVSPKPKGRFPFRPGMMQPGQPGPCGKCPMMQPGQPGQQGPMKKQNFEKRKKQAHDDDDDDDD